MDLAKRLISAAVMMAIIIVCLILGGWVMVGLATFVSVLAMIDVTGAFKQAGFRPCRVLLMIVAGGILPAYYFLGLTGSLLLMLVAFILMSCTVILSKEPDFKNIFCNAFCLVYPLLSGLMLVILTCYDVRHTGRLGTILMVGVVTCPCMADAFAYFGGRLFGKRKLCPKISPKKTVAGCIASFAGGTVGGALIYLIFHRAYADYAEMGLLSWLIVGFICGFLAQIGDLTASMLKRFCGIKDFGNYIPGHGGIMDRLDSVAACLYVFIFYVHFFVTELI